MSEGYKAGVDRYMTDGWTDGRTDGRTDSLLYVGLMLFFINGSYCILAHYSMTFCSINRANNVHTDVHKDSKTKKCTLKTRMMLRVECWTLHSLNCHRFNYVAKGEGLSDSDY